MWTFLALTTLEGKQTIHSNPWFDWGAVWTINFVHITVHTMAFIAADGPHWLMLTLGARSVVGGLAGR